MRTSVSRSASPTTCCGENGASVLSAIIFVTMSAMTMIATTGQNTTALGVLLLGIFLALLADDAEAGVRERVESLVGDVLAARLALVKALGIALKNALDMLGVTALNKM